MNIGPIGGGTLPVGGAPAGAPVSGQAGGGTEAKIKELEKKLRNLTEEKKKAEQNHDAEKAKELEEEIRKVKEQLEELKRKAKKEEEKQEEEKKGGGQNGQPPVDGQTGQYLNTWA